MTGRQAGATLDQEIGRWRRLVYMLHKKLGSPVAKGSFMWMMRAFFSRVAIAQLEQLPLALDFDRCLSPRPLRRDRFCSVKIVNPCAREQATMRLVKGGNSLNWSVRIPAGGKRIRSLRRGGFDVRDDAFTGGSNRTRILLIYAPVPSPLICTSAGY